jgi:formylmethanofuran dehydrogenase subunit C
MRVSLNFGNSHEYPIDAKDLLPESLLIIEKQTIEKIKIIYGSLKTQLGEIARVTVEVDKPDELVLSGKLSGLYHIGFGMNGGCLRLQGDVGDQVCERMRDGEVFIEGDAGDDLGLGMQDGSILITSSIGADAGREMRRGLILALGDSGPFTGANLRAGTIMVFGTLGAQPGIEMKRGSLVARSAGELPPSFRCAGPADVEWLHVYFCYLAGRSIKIPAGWWNNNWWRFTGDHLNLGKGEILLHEKL